jgi:acyl-coenzyme A synthetase/AMP-(fatty) acid ligase/SAM-dependent methyltransferase
MTFFFPTHSFHATNGETTGWLTPANDALALPVVNGLVLADHADWPLPELLTPRVAELQSQLAAKASAYEEFIRRKSRRPAPDAYVAFQPFNEATRAFFPFVNLLRERLRPGDVILNFWDRSGYLASLLAGLFPQQTVLAHWEGDRDVLGYAGYGHWLTGPGAPPNVRVFFSDPQKPLPLPDGSVALVVAPDVLHRFDQAHLLRELLRVTRPDGGLIFPHVHLANAEPEPFFERGGRRLHGRQYDRLFAEKTASGGRQAFIFSEPDLFQFNETAPSGAEKTLHSTPDTPDYNALVALLPPAWLGSRLTPFRAAEEEDWETGRVLVNPLLDFRHPSGRMRVADAAGPMLARHPVYAAHLSRAVGYAPSDQARHLLYWADRAMTGAEIGERLGVSSETLRPLLRDLTRRDIVQVVPFGETCHRRQHFLTTQDYQPASAEQTLAHLWHRAVTRYAENPLLLALADGSECTYAEADELVRRTRAALRRDGLHPGDAVGFYAPLHAEGLLLAWACWLEGLVFVPLNVEWLPATVRESLQTVQPALLLTTEAEARKLGHIPWRVLFLDEENTEPSPAAAPLFADWLGEEFSENESFTPTPHTRAVVLFTSGSTGRPKGVPLTHGQLFRSAWLVTETFGWEATDRYLAVGEADAMSGLRNAALAPLEVGAAVVLPTRLQKQSAFALAEAVAEGRATLLTVAPPLLRQWVQAGRRLASALRSLRLVLSTGSALSPDLRDAFTAQVGPPVVNYYGLTETTGICLAERPAQVRPGRDTVGWPVGCLADVVDEAGCPLPVGAVGELRIFGENVTRESYLGAPEAPSLVRGGWLYTGDLAAFNPDGSLTLRGRRSDRIKNAHSEVVYPAEVEAQVLRFPAVHDAVVCAYRQHDTEKLAAFLTLRTGYDADHVVGELPRFLAERVGSRKIPATFRVVDTLPRSTSGKVRRDLLLTLLEN